MRTLTAVHSRALWSLLMLPIAGSLFAQSECAQLYDDARTQFERSGGRPGCIAMLDSALGICGHDREQAARMLFLKALAEAGEDSLERMRSDLERLFRTDRRFVIKAYDLPVKGRGEADLYGAWEQLWHRLRKDHGRWRAGVHAGGQGALLEVSSERHVFQSDPSLTYSGELGWQVGAHGEWDMVPNLAVRAGVGYSTQSYEAHSSTQQYTERITLLPASLGVKKMFWVADHPWVPYAVAEVTYARLLTSEAEIARSGDGLRFLAAKTLNRIVERERDQMMAGGTIGIGRKVSDVVIFLEAGYRHAITTLTLADETYAESELLTNYYWVDNELSVSSVSLTIGVSYILAYHQQNRIYRP